MRKRKVSTRPSISRMEQSRLMPCTCSYCMVFVR